MIVYPLSATETRIVIVASCFAWFALALVVVVGVCVSLI